MTIQLSFVMCSTETLSRNINLITNLNVDSIVKVNATGQVGLVNAKVGG